MNRFRKPGVIIAALLLAFPNLWGEDEPLWYDTTDHFVVDGVHSEYGDDYITVAIAGTENRIYMAYNFDIVLPPGVTFLTAGTVEGEYSYVIGDIVHNLEDGIYPTANRRPYAPYHTLSSSVKDNGTRAKVICYSTENLEFLKPTGAICDYYVEVHPLAKAGVNDVMFKDMVFNSKNPESGFPIQWAPGNTLYNIAWSTITIPAERTVEVDIPADTKWGTLILPFALTALPDGVEAFHAARINNSNEVELESVESLEAYKPYIVRATNGWQATLTGVASEENFPVQPMMLADDEYHTVYPRDAIATLGVLNANIKPHQLTDGYLLSTAGEQPAFTRVTEENPQILSTGDVFLTLPEDFTADTPESLPLKVKDSTTIIAEINAETTLAAPIYNLQGQRVVIPRSGCLYISGGRIFRK